MLLCDLLNIIILLMSISISMLAGVVAVAEVLVHY